MSTRRKTILSWSGGKDSALALWALRRDAGAEVLGLLTTVSAEYRRISHHGVREELLERQAASIGLPLHRIRLPTGPSDRCTNEIYERLLARSLLGLRKKGVTHVAHGDIFLQDLREYRERNLARIGLAATFPLWGRDTAGLVREFLDAGFRAHVVCVDGRKLDGSFAGRPLDAAFLADLPPGVDPCGENGEFHSFVHDGPIFRRTVPVTVGRVVQRDVRFFADLLPAGATDETTDALPPAGAGERA